MSLNKRFWHIKIEVNIVVLYLIKLCFDNKSKSLHCQNSNLSNRFQTYFKPTRKLVWPNRFVIELQLFACVHMTAKPIWNQFQIVFESLM